MPASESHCPKHVVIAVSKLSPDLVPIRTGVLATSQLIYVMLWGGIVGVGVRIFFYISHQQQLNVDRKGRWAASPPKLQHLELPSHLFVSLPLLIFICAKPSICLSGSVAGTLGTPSTCKPQKGCCRTLQLLNFAAKQAQVGITAGSQEGVSWSKS